MRRWLVISDHVTVRGPQTDFTTHQPFLVASAETAECPRFRCGVASHARRHRGRRPSRAVAARTSSLTHGYSLDSAALTWHVDQRRASQASKSRNFGRPQIHCRRVEFLPPNMSLRRAVSLCAGSSLRAAL